VVSGSPSTVHHVATQSLGAGNSRPCDSTVTFTWT
jgi:hypothetical protein